MMENSLGLHPVPMIHTSTLIDPTSPGFRLVSNPLSHITQAACQAVTSNVQVRIPAKLSSSSLIRPQLQPTVKHEGRKIRQRVPRTLRSRLDDLKSLRK